MPTPSTSNDAALARFLAACERALHQHRFDKLLSAGYHGPQADLKPLSVRTIELRGQPHLNFVYSHERRDITKNLPVAEGLPELCAPIGPAFANAHLHTPDEELQLSFSRKGLYSLRVGKGSGPAGDVAGAPSAPCREPVDLHRFLGHQRLCGARSNWKSRPGVVARGRQLQSEFKFNAAFP